jgi:formate-dependent nitrite reductase membrane component NrfD
MGAVLALFRLEGATRGQIFVRGLFLSLSAPTLFFSLVAASNRHVLLDWILLVGSVVALTTELLAIRNFQRVFGGVNWMSAICIPLAFFDGLVGLVMGGTAIAVLYDHASARYDVLWMVIAILLGIGVLRGIFGVRWKKRKYNRAEIVALCAFVPGTLLVFVFTLRAIFEEIFSR